ncbi:3-dehydroquinate synthase [Cyclobacterium marinum]|uniref:3-dehydroquinate synthase n=1 Tax=Cyclobacterium marinum (strain ATCC 25205 / DSM 745 / LMG 13164 / NCIMB 1802) TaxID=880070 RepID=G0IXE9_CYCMS|nr:3-dehydroquinate synthase [Cyclobacterium marinum]AEL26374.1 3-dehydroquinate synthase [Cyclobacterium marinum DSM 745]MBI0399716.1 3-dehydroquinate synthase [Cyclobacterium marinum]MBR9774068.1 3-dehydroquinate synthase [Cytophagales bacterium]
METIIFSSRIAQDLTRFLDSKKYSKLGVIMDSNTVKHCYPLVSTHLPEHSSFIFEAGEVNKTLDTCVKIWDWMTENSFDRKTLILNIGGGVTGDMGGFCASTYKRGIRFINLPTTLLSQVDASVGGKLGIDFKGFKNHIGVFNQPEGVLIGEEFLGTLPEPELRSGYAEVIKHGLIRNVNYFNSLKTENWQAQSWKDIISVSVGIKRDVVDKDPKEDGLRKILNFGHTIGHAVESYYLDTPFHLLHGEAIAIGMIAEAYLSHKFLRLPKEELGIIQENLLAVFGKIQIDKKGFDTIIDLCFQDKKNEGNALNFSLLKRIGECDFNIVVGREAVAEALDYYNQLSN